MGDGGGRCGCADRWLHDGSAHVMVPGKNTAVSPGPRDVGGDVLQQWPRTVVLCALRGPNQNIPRRRILGRGDYPGDAGIDQPDVPNNTDAGSTLTEVFVFCFAE